MDEGGESRERGGGTFLEGGEVPPDAGVIQASIGGDIVLVSLIILQTNIKMVFTPEYLRFDTSLRSDEHHVLVQAPSNQLEMQQQDEQLDDCCR